ncbi:MAG: ABC transporter ATP-binding protein [Clostridia bacterium]|nr:ABC transporter ATP-binding protein [Clostridia bacterium]MBQ2720774.1 ABC transporter ATP-binding protein [Clostridia bacterium]MBQ4627935.1 ABC transporter ATP-binding protein [Clostridia bacterium]
MQPVIKVENLKKIYKLGTESVTALGGVDLEINKGEICFLVGTSGSGKSTLLNMIAGLEKPTSGTVVLNGTHIEKMNERKLAVFRQKNLGFVFQSYNLLPTMTAQENVAMPLMFSGKKQSVRDKKAKAMLLAVGLGARLRHKPTQMSGGQQQRVAIARAFVSDPPIILADEPTGNLDSSTTVEVMNMIVDLVRKNNQTLVVVTHEPELAVYGDKVVHIKDGMIERMEINSDPVRKMETQKTEQTLNQ